MARGKVGLQFHLDEEGKINAKAQPVNQAAKITVCGSVVAPPARMSPVSDTNSTSLLT